MNENVDYKNSLFFFSFLFVTKNFNKIIISILRYFTCFTFPIRAPFQSFFITKTVSMWTQCSISIAQLIWMNRAEIFLFMTQVFLIISSLLSLARPFSQYNFVCIVHYMILLKIVRSNNGNTHTSIYSGEWRRTGEGRSKWWRSV